MTDGEFIGLAWQYGDIVSTKRGSDAWEIPVGNLLEFARAIEQRTLTNQKAKWYQEGVEAEREACARLCEESRTKYVDRAISEPRTIDPEVARVAMMTCDFIAHDIRARGEWTPDDTAYRADGLSQDEPPPVKSYCGGKPNYCETKPVADVNTSEERVPNPDKQRHECQELKASGPIGEIIEAHGLIAVSIPEMPPVGTKLYAAPYRLWVTLSDDDTKEIVGDWGDEPEPFLWYSLYVMHETGSNQDAILPFKPHDDGDWIPLYTAPPKREWQVLTDDEIAQAVGSPLDEVYLADFRKVEAKLMEKNNAKPNRDMCGND